MVGGWVSGGWWWVGRGGGGGEPYLCLHGLLPKRLGVLRGGLPLWGHLLPAVVQRLRPSEGMGGVRGQRIPSVVHPPLTTDISPICLIHQVRSGQLQPHPCQHPQPGSHPQVYLHPHHNPRPLPCRHPHPCNNLNPHPHPHLHAHSCPCLNPHPDPLFSFPSSSPSRTATSPHPDPRSPAHPHLQPHHRPHHHPLPRPKSPTPSPVMPPPSPSPPPPPRPQRHSPVVRLRPPHKQPVVHIAQRVGHVGLRLVMPPLAVHNEFVLVVAGAGRQPGRGIGWEEIRGEAGCASVGRSPLLDDTQCCHTVCAGHSTPQGGGGGQTSTGAARQRRGTKEMEPGPEGGGVTRAAGAP